MTKAPIRVANFSGALGDYIGAFADVIADETIDVAIGDYLAEMTMGRVAEGFCGAGKPQALAGYYADIFLRQITPELGRIAERGVKVVTNAGAFNPAGLATLIAREAAAQGLALCVAYVEGDDLLGRVPALAGGGQLTHLDDGAAIGPIADRLLAANAYLGGWGIAAALEQGADIVICGRVSDASLVLGPAAWWHGWAKDDWDALAGSVAAGHIIECGPQAMGGNFSGFTQLGAPTRLGFPIAEIGADGSAVITKRAGDAGVVTVDTVTAQLMYEIQGTHYLNPDVVLHIDSIALSQQGPDRVQMSGVRGGPAPETTKVGCFYQHGWRAMIWGFATGPDWREKAEWLRVQLEAMKADLALDEFHFEPLGQPITDPASEAEATVAIRIAAAAQNRSSLSKLLAGYASFGLGGIPGFQGDGAGPPQPRVHFWPGLVRQADLDHRVVFVDGPQMAVAMPPVTPFSAPAPAGPAPAAPPGDTRAVLLGSLVHARSGDKGANANIGLWVQRPEIWPWLRDTLDADRLAQLMGLDPSVTVERHDLPNINGLLFVLKGYFGTSGTGNIALDQIGKAAGEFLRARIVQAPTALVGDAMPLAASR
ncbi:acyclic terpene utilization AtuA family protein [Sphingobium sp.]|uniref:acyclic terpene utilization AtuA family protein n=1 Tax=Sphingobium TaxID=165695 RepID=UPI001A188BEC|nr:acyclic terpene utilization AtuA family protein [Sphingobium sp.]MBJ7375221.1 DUF1446 domain-containing protein [Sphingobium sp.]